MANGFLRRRRTEEYQAKQAEAKASGAVEEEIVAADEPVTGPVISAPMGGRIIEIKVKPGQEVKPGEIMLVYEAMKMENDVTADKKAVVKRVFVKVDEVVGTDAPLIEFQD